jgi:demethylmenaquinone methyltransferase/2-methoxy-6-polyprenyl-1,4-benzoquinol methylase
MLEVARTKTLQLELAGRVEYVQGDAQSLPFPDHSFDAISMAFGIRNVTDRSAALAEIARVASPGAKIALLELTEPLGKGFAAVARLHVHWIVPMMGAIISGSREYAYLSRSIAAFPAPHAFVRTAESIGLVPLKILSFSFGACHLFVFTPRAEGSP